FGSQPSTNDRPRRRKTRPCYAAKGPAAAAFPPTRGRFTPRLAAQPPSRSSERGRGLDGPGMLRPRVVGPESLDLTRDLTPFHPGGMNENSPAFQRWDRGLGVQVPKGRLNLPSVGRPLRDSCAEVPCSRQPLIKLWLR